MMILGRPGALDHPLGRQPWCDFLLILSFFYWFSLGFFHWFSTKTREIVAPILDIIGNKQAIGATFD